MSKPRTMKEFESGNYILLTERKLPSSTKNRKYGKYKLHHILFRHSTFLFSRKSKNIFHFHLGKKSLLHHISRKKFFSFTYQIPFFIFYQQLDFVTNLFTENIS